MSASRDHEHLGRLDEKTQALASIGALVGNASGCSYRDVVARALAAGASDDEIVAVLWSVAPIVGLVDLVAASVPLADGLGVDLERAFEFTEEGGRPADRSSHVGDESHPPPVS